MAGAWVWPPSPTSAKDESTSSCVSILHVLILLSLIKHKDNFAFTLTLSYPHSNSSLFGNHVSADVWVNNSKDINWILNMWNFVFKNIWTKLVYVESGPTFKKSNFALVSSWMGQFYNSNTINLALSDIGVKAKMVIMISNYVWIICVP